MQILHGGKFMQLGRFLQNGQIFAGSSRSKFGFAVTKSVSLSDYSTPLNPNCLKKTSFPGFSFVGWGSKKLAACYENYYKEKIRRKVDTYTLKRKKH